jgi:Ca2+-binding RTX toxin-like protein
MSLRQHRNKRSIADNHAKGLAAPMILAIVALMGVLLLATLVESHPAPPTHLDDITTENDYLSTIVVFSAPVRHDAVPLVPPTDPPLPLTASDFVLQDANPGVTILDVQPVGSDRTTWRVRFQGDEIAPHVGILKNQTAAGLSTIEDDVGLPVTLFEPIPFSKQDVSSLHTRIKALQMLPEQIEETMETEMTPALEEQKIPLPMVAPWLNTHRNLADLIPGVGGVPTVDSERALKALLENNVQGIGSLLFTSAGAQLNFAPTEISGAPTPTHTIPVHYQVGRSSTQVYRFVIDGTLPAKAFFDGRINFAITDVITTTFDPVAIPTLHITANAPLTGAGRLGIVDVDGTGTGVLGATLALTPAANTPVTLDDVTVGGTAGVSIASLTVPGSTLGAFTGTGGSPLVEFQWPDLHQLFANCDDGTAPQDGLCGGVDPPPPRCADFSQPVNGLCPGEPPQPPPAEQFCSDGSSIIDGKCGKTQAPDNVNVPHDEIDGQNLRGFTRVTTEDVLRGLIGVAGWISIVDDDGIFETPLPVTGGRVGDLTNVGGTVASPAAGLAQLYTVFAAGTPTGDVSVQSLRTLCDATDAVLNAKITEFWSHLEFAYPAGADDTERAAVRDQVLENLTAEIPNARDDCQGLLDSLTLGLSGIQFAVGTQDSNEFFNTTNPPVMALGLNDDLSGITVQPVQSPGTAWHGEATNTLSFTYGVRLVPTADLGLQPNEKEIAQRAYVEPGTIATSALEITGSELLFTGHLGFLDFVLAGDGATGQPDVSLDPSFTFTLVDTDGRVTLGQMAATINNDNVDSILQIATTGGVDASFLLSNPIVYSASRNFDVTGNFVSHELPDDVWEFDPSQITVSADLGDGLRLKSLIPSEALQVVTKLSQQMIALANSPLLSQSIPLLDARFQEAVGFASDFAEISRRVTQSSPQDISALHKALSDALTSVGMTGGLQTHVTADALAFSFDAGQTVSKTFPFSFEHDLFSFAPADGGASMTAAASMIFEPTFGLLFNGPSMDDRLFLQGAGPSFGLSIHAQTFGTVYLGPLPVGIQGIVRVGNWAAGTEATSTTTSPAKLEVLLLGVSPTDRINLTTLKTAFTAADGGPLLDTQFVGKYYANLVVDVAGVTKHVTILGDLTGGVPTFTTDISLADLTLDLQTLIFGFVEAGRFVGRALKSSESSTVDMPVIGDGIRALNTAGEDLEAAADAVNTLWESTKSVKSQMPQPGKFIKLLEAELEDALCPTTHDCVTIFLDDVAVTATTSEDAIVGAQKVEIKFDIKHVTHQVETLSGGIDAAPIFEVDLALSPMIDYGYRVDLIMGLDRADGFYIRPNGTNDVFQAFAKFHIEPTTSAQPIATILGVSASLLPGTEVSLGGDLYQGGGGFALGLNEPLKLRDLSNRHHSVDEIMSARFSATLTGFMPILFEPHIDTDTRLISLTLPIEFGVSTVGGKPEHYLSVGTQAHQISMDLAAVREGILEPILDTLSGFDPSDNKYNVFQQEMVHALFTTDIPVIDTTLEELLDNTAGDLGYGTEWSIVKFLLNVPPADDVSGVLDLGYVGVLPVPDKTNVKTTAQSRADPTKSAAWQSVDDVLSQFPVICAFPPCNPEPEPILDFPIFDELDKIPGLVFGGELASDVRFVELKTGRLELGPKLNLQHTVSMDIGFIDGHLTVGLDGFYGVIIDMGIGLDSSGIRTGNILDGFYLVDTDGIMFGVGGHIGVLVDGHFAVFGDVASVHFHGSGRAAAEAGVDLFDDSPAVPEHSRNDGRMNFNEMKSIAESYDEGFICIFKLHIGVTVDLAFSGKAKVLGVTVFDESFSEHWDVVDEDITCELPISPAHVEEKQLVLNGGTFAEWRFDSGNDVAEAFEISQSGSDVTVHMTSPSDKSKVFSTDDFDVIYAELGSEADNVFVDPSVTVPVILHGGAGNDRLVGGSAADEIFGEGGSNLLDGGPGDDVLYGGAGDDTLVASAGHDELLGGAGANTYRIPSGWGKAEISDEGFQGTLDFGSFSDSPTSTYTMTGVSEALTATASFYDGLVKTASGGRLEYQTDEIRTIRGGSAPDSFEVNRYAPPGFSIDAMGGYDTLSIPLSGQQRTITVHDSGAGALLKSEGTSSSDLVFFRARCFHTASDPTGTACDPTIGAQEGFIGLLSPSGDLDRINYDNTILRIEFQGGGGTNQFILDDTAAPLEITGGPSKDIFQVGQLFGLGKDRTPPNVAAGDEVRTRDVEARGPMSLGVSYPTTLNGSAGNDEMTVFSNMGDLTLQGYTGDDLFILRAFIVAGSVDSAGGDGFDHFEYVQNAQVHIDGGDGFDTIVIIGTELSDGFVLSATELNICPIYGEADNMSLPPEQRLPSWSPVSRLPQDQSSECGIDADYVNVESIVAHGLEGNDAFWIQGASSAAYYRLFGGIDGDTFLVGDKDGHLETIQGAVEIDGAADPSFSDIVPPPIVLPGEEGSQSAPGLDRDYFDQEDDVLVWGEADTAGTPGRLAARDLGPNGTAGLVSGLQMIDHVSFTYQVPNPATSDPDDVMDETRTFPGGVTFIRQHTLEVRLGSGNDAFTIERTHEFIDKHVDGTETFVDTRTVVKTNDGEDDVAVQTIQGPTYIELGADNGVVRVGSVLEPGASHPDSMSNASGIGDTLQVNGSAVATDLSHLKVDASGTDVTTLGERLDVDVTVDEWSQTVERVRGLSTVGEILLYAGDSVEVFLTEGEDVANVQGTLVPTTIHGLEADDRFFVSDVANVDVDDPTPPLLGGKIGGVGAQLDLQGGLGDNLLFVSDRANTAATLGAILDEDSLVGFAPGSILYDAEGTFIQGIVVWTGAGANGISVEGARLDGDPTLIKWEGRPSGVDVRTITTLNTLGGPDTVDVKLPTNHGFFVLNTGAGDDVVNGGTSQTGFVVFGEAGNDRLTTSGFDDIVFGDHGRVVYCQGPTVVKAPNSAGLNCGFETQTVLGNADVANLNDGIARAPFLIKSEIVGTPAALDGVAYATSATLGTIWPTGFNNRISVGTGDNIAFGGTGSDLIEAAAGFNAIVGDAGQVWRLPTSALGGASRIQTREGFIDIQVLTGTAAYVVDLFGAGQKDLVLGGSGADTIFAGLGQDDVNAGAGPDLVWGGDDADILWGGEGDDRIYAGNGDDAVDLKRSSFDAGLTTGVTDAAWWKLAWYTAPTVDSDLAPLTHNGDDLIYGGRLRDVLHADRGRAGPAPGDRLADWYGSYNLYLICDSAYGAGRTLRDITPDIVGALQQLGTADGAFDIMTKTSSGYAQIALVIDEFTGENRGAPHPNHPGNKAGC